MEPSEYDDIPLCKILYFVRRKDYWRNKQIGMHNSSENGRRAWIALCAILTHADTDTEMKFLTQVFCDI
jgi:hypothetical protein